MSEPLPKGTSYEDAREKMTAACVRLKSYFPFRVVWGAINPTTFEFDTGATPTRRQVNSYIRKDWEGFVY